MKIIFSYVLSVLMRRVFVWGYPAALSVETCGFCNLRCPECPTGNNSLMRDKANISPDVYFKIIDELSPYLSHLYLYFQGEPFLNPNLFDFIKYATRRKIYTAVSTNAHFLTTTNIDKIFDSGLRKIIISLDGFTALTYQKYRVGGDFDLVVGGVKALCVRRKELKRKHPRIVVQFLVFKHNEHEMVLKDVVERDLGVDSIEFKSAQIYNLELGDEILPRNTKYSRYKKNANGVYTLKKTLKNRCFRIWHTAIFTGKADIIPCCFDKDADYVFGNATVSTVYSLWHSVGFRCFRRKVLTNRAYFEICRNCTE